MRKYFSITALAALIFGLCFAGTALGVTIGSIFNPNDYASLGNLVLTGGDTLTFDTDALTVSGTTGGLSSTSGVSASSASTNVDLVVFTFDSIDLPDGVGITVTGSKGLALLSKSGINFDTDINVSGAAGGTASGSGAASGGSGGPGAAGSGGDAKNNDGGGQGGGQAGGSNGGGGGGGHASAGGDGGRSNGSFGGTAYSDAALTDLFGGSGGASGNVGGGGGTSDVGAGGGGGGALELAAINNIEIGVNAMFNIGGGDGGNGSGSSDEGGGGGSGGSLLVAAFEIDFLGGIDAGGGNGGASLANSDRGGGGGSGGRVAFYSNDIIAGIPVGLDLAGGTATKDGDPGGIGSFFDGDAPAFAQDPDAQTALPAVPEPATAALGVLSLLAIGIADRRRRGCRV